MKLLIARRIHLISLVALAVISCGTFTTTLPTPPEPTLTPAQTHTHTPPLTRTPLPGETPTHTPAIFQPIMQDMIEVKEGGFSFKPVEGFTLRIAGEDAFIYEPGGDMFVMLLSGAFEESTGYTAEAFIEEVMEMVADECNDDTYGYTPIQPLSVARTQGEAYRLSAEVCGETMQGQAVSVKMPNGRYLIPLAMISLADGKIDAWQNKGAPVFSAVLASIQFLDAADIAPSSTLPPTPTPPHTPTAPVGTGWLWETSG